MIYQRNFQASELPSKVHISCYKYITRDFDYYPMHTHSYYEISFVAEGERILHFNGKEVLMKRNSLAFLPPLCAHGNQNLSAVKDVVLQISADMFCYICECFDSKMIFALADESVPCIQLDDGSPILETLMELYELCNETGRNSPSEDKKRIIAFEMKRNGLILDLISKMIDCGFVTVKSGTLNLSKISLLDELVNRIIQNPHEKTDMQEAAKFVGMSYYHFSRVFKELTGTNYTEYCNVLRIRRAEELLRNKDLPISQIAYEIGIDTPGYFTRLFKSINGITPAQYRNRR